MIMSNFPCGECWQDAVDEGFSPSDRSTPARQPSFTSPGYNQTSYPSPGYGQSPLSPLALGSAPKYQPSLQVRLEAQGVTLNPKVLHRTWLAWKMEMLFVDKTAQSKWRMRTVATNNLSVQSAPAIILC